MKNTQLEAGFQVRILLPANLYRARESCPITPEQTVESAHLPIRFIVVCLLISDPLEIVQESYMPNQCAFSIGTFKIWNINAIHVVNQCDLLIVSIF